MNYHSNKSEHYGVKYYNYKMANDDKYKLYKSKSRYHSNKYNDYYNLVGGDKSVTSYLYDNALDLYRQYKKLSLPSDWGTLPDLSKIFNNLPPNSTLQEELKYSQLFNAESDLYKLAVKNMIYLICNDFIDLGIIVKIAILTNDLEDTFNGKGINIDDFADNVKCSTIFKLQCIIED